MSKKKKIILGLIILLLVSIVAVFALFAIKGKDTTDANMSFVINDTLIEGNGEKVKVFLIGGQSNADGVSIVSELEKNVSEDKFNEYKNGYENILINYYNSNGNNKSNGFTKVTINQGYQTGYFGPELGMGEKLNELYPNEKIFIIKYAWGGSNLHTQWNSEIGNLYRAFIKFVDESMDYLKSKNYDAEIVSMMWMQGESDSGFYNSLKYEENTSNLIKSIRKDLKEHIQDEGMYFVDAYISSSPYWKHYENVNEAKQKVCDSSNLNICVDTIKENLSVDKEPINNPDLAHYDSLSEIKLGHLFVLAFINKK